MTSNDVNNDSCMLHLYPSNCRSPDCVCVCVSCQVAKACLHMLQGTSKGPPNMVVRWQVRWKHIWYRCKDWLVACLKYAEKYLFGIECPPFPAKQTSTSTMNTRVESIEWKQRSDQAWLLHISKWSQKDLDRSRSLFGGYDDCFISKSNTTDDLAVKTTFAELQQQVAFVIPILWSHTLQDSPCSCPSQARLPANETLQGKSIS